MSHSSPSTALILSSSSLFVQLLELTPHIVWLANDQAQLVQMNSAWQRYTGRENAAAIGEPVWQFFHEAEQPVLQTAWQRGVRNRQGWQESARLRMADGSYEWFAIIAQPVNEDESPNLVTPNLCWMGTIVRLASTNWAPQLLSGQEFLEALFENIAEGLVACNSAGQLVLFNRAAQEFHGLPPKPIPTDRWAEYYDLYDGTGTQPLAMQEVPLMRALRGEKLRSTEIMIKPKTGQARSLLVNADPIVDASGQQLGAVALMRDVTDYRQAEAALKLSEQRFQAIFNQTFQFIGLLSPEGILLEANQTALQFGGITADKVLQRPFWETHWWQTSAATKHHLQQAIKQAAAGEFVRYEVEVLNAQGQPTPIDFSLSPVRDETGQVVMIIPEGRDISEQKQLEAELRSSQAELEAKVAQRTAELAEREAQFRTTFEQAAIGFCHVKLDGHWARVNDKLCDILGYSREELLQKSFQDVTHPEDLAEDLALVEALLAGKIPHYFLEKRYIRGDGTIVWARITVSLRRELTATPDILGQPIHFIATIEDINDRKRLEAQDKANRRVLEAAKQALERRNQELDQFVYIASHDLKAPLRGIANLSEWIEEDLTGQLPPENQEQLVLLRSRVKRMENLINGLLQYSRLGRQEVDTIAVDVRELLLEVIDSLNPPATFQIQLPNRMPQFQAHRLLLSQVFANLISNSIKHHDRDTGQVVITWDEQGNYYRFCVEDDGPGIPTNQQSRVFGIFQTLNGNDASDNTGIGLALIKKIIEGEGGTITLESNGDRGCRFEFTWPKACVSKV